MDKQTAIDILKDIQTQLNTENWKDNTLRTINQYEKGLKITTNPKIKKLILKHKDFIKKYGEDDKRTLKINKKIDEELHKIYNN